MKVLPLLLLPFIGAPAIAGDLSNYRAYRDYGNLNRHATNYMDWRMAQHTDSQAGYSHQRTCFKSEYREEYIPGTENNPGYVKSYKERVKVPCKNRPRRHDHHHHHVPPAPTRSNVDDNSCVEGTVVGGILGGGAAALGSRGDGYAWSVPLGVVGGSLIGCQIDGG